MEYNVFQNRNVLNAAKNAGWKLLLFDEVFVDETSKTSKIQKNDYLEEGITPIIDQGQTFIGGYSNNNLKVYDELPVIIFGDHTRKLKFIDFSFYLGADGVKLLKCKIEADRKYLYYFLKSVELPSDGYSRHFKYLKQLIIPLPDLPTQQKIANTLDKATELIEKRKTQITALDDLTQSIFYDMFGDPFYVRDDIQMTRLGEITQLNPKKLEVKDLSNDTMVSFIPMNVVGEKGELNTLEKKCLSELYKGFTYCKDGDVLFAKITPCMENGKGTIARNLTNGIAFGSTEFHVLRPLEGVTTSEWIYVLTSLKKFRLSAGRKMTGSAGQRRVPVNFLENFEIQKPCIEKQKEFTKTIQKIKQQKELQQQGLVELETNFNALMQKAFKGELFK